LTVLQEIHIVTECVNNIPILNSRYCCISLYGSS